MFDGGMEMFFRMRNFPTHLIGSLSKHKIYYKNRPVFHPSILLQTNGIDNLPGSGVCSASAVLNSQSTSLLLRQVNTIGIIGGRSSLSTLSFLEKVVQSSSNDGEDSLPFVVCNDPILNKELLFFERSYFPYHNTKNARTQFDSTPVVESLRQKRDFLEQAGARCIVMPCHISHAWHDEISHGSSVNFLHVGECVAKELKEAKLKPLEAGSNLRIGILATDATLGAGFYQEKLRSQGFEVVLPDKATMEHTVVPALEALERKDMEGARNLLRIALQVLIVRAVNTIILASDDMLELLPRDDPLLKRCIDPMDALARSAIKWAQSTDKVHKRS
ncbi:hypothetical protein GIB67_021377 [Kingdonia uniflora]|uniref:Aspartate racemase n=1 Tax=Kingdonia uniflora TaxID=39325 RepID=A0A7J7MCX8_9MAGN|nr:hypothetical protein GIB67_021377 [Kingdonia uniflora]